MSSGPNKKRQKMSKPESPDEVISFNYKELGIIGKGMYWIIINTV